MNTPPRPSPPARKLHRAAMHIQALETAIAEYSRSDWYKEQSRQLPDGNFHIQLEFREPPDDIGAIVGDVVHNLRAALDLLAVDLVERNGGNAKNVYFPFADSADALEKMILTRGFHRAGKVSMDRLRSLRPFKGGNVLLRALHDLDIQDKHRSLIPVLSEVSTSAVSVRPRIEGDLSSGLVAEIVRSQPPAARFLFPADSALAGQPIVEALWQLHEVVSHAVDLLAGPPRT